MSSLCPSLHFFTKRNESEKIKREKRKEIYIAISQPVEKLYDHEIF